MVVTLNIVVQAFLPPNVSTGFPLMTLLIFLATMYLTHILMELIIKWRLVMVVARSEKSPMEQKKERIRARARIRRIILCSPFVWGLLFLATFVSGISSFLPGFLLPFLSTIQVALFLAFVIGLDVLIVYSTSRSKWKNLRKEFKGTKFADYLKPLQK